jgi:hypothetical protein
MDSPKCLACPHLAKQHNLDKGGDRCCRVKILSGWSDEKNTYTASKRCGCPGYAGLDPDADSCAHEFLKEGGCVHCGCPRAVTR